MKDYMGNELKIGDLVVVPDFYGCDININLKPAIIVDFKNDIISAKVYDIDVPNDICEDCIEEFFDQELSTPKILQFRRWGVVKAQYDEKQLQFLKKYIDNI